MQISAKTDYAIRALLTLAAHDPQLVKMDAIITDQGLPVKYVEAILSELRRCGLVRTQRGAEGGYCLSRPPEEIMLGAILRAIDGPLAEVRGMQPEETHYRGAAEHLPDVWVAVRGSLERVLEETSLADVVSGVLPSHVRQLTESRSAWQRHGS